MNDGGEIVHQADKECWKVKGEDDPVLEVWESYNGDLYFITQKDNVSGSVFMYARLYAMPQFAEWGSNNINYLREQYGSDKLWQVQKKNWANIETYEKGLLVKCSEHPSGAGLSAAEMNEMIEKAKSGLVVGKDAEALAELLARISTGIVDDPSLSDRM